ncbi:hypothetical protein CHS0354_022363 [Potamilus streckersoni]|uniref:VWFD domain-containing protein n=1 Tax=Potamilus streckersoni TaxID=2493646 RepID=A0AAE0T2G4_9BIVA|nr:hypothetical protein CHS0354_022363 [Potamilus streckersoni]
MFAANNEFFLIQVQVQEDKTWIGKNCYAHIDPHMMTFDQKPYENQNLGEFVLYRHAEYKQEVQMKTFDCNGPKCACAVSIRAGGELFIINVCTIPSLINHAYCREKLMNIRKIHQYKYEIHMPLGTMVVVDIINWPPPLFSLNIDITPSVKDVGKTLGLCGTLNNNMADDFTRPSNTITPDNNEFSNSWKINISKSSFLDPLYQPDMWDKQLFLCVCPAALKTSTVAGTVSGNRRDPLCSPSVYQACTNNMSHKTEPSVFRGTEYNDNHCNIISKRSLTSQEKEIQRILSSNRILDVKTFQTMCDIDIIQEIMCDRDIVQEISCNRDIIKETMCDIDIVQEIKCDRDIIKEIMCDIDIVQEISCNRDIIKETMCDIDIIKEIMCDRDIIKEIMCDSDTVQKIKCDRDIIKEIMCDSDTVHEIMCDSDFVQKIMCDSDIVQEIMCHRDIFQEISCDRDIITESMCDSDTVHKIMCDSDVLHEIMCDSDIVQEIMCDRDII